MSICIREADGRWSDSGDVALSAYRVTGAGLDMVASEVGR